MRSVLEHLAPGGGELGGAVGLDPGTVEQGADLSHQLVVPDRGLPVRGRRRRQPLVHLEVPRELVEHHALQPCGWASVPLGTLTEQSEIAVLEDVGEPAGVGPAAVQLRGAVATLAVVVDRIGQVGHGRLRHVQEIDAAEMAVLERDSEPLVELEVPTPDLVGPEERRRRVAVEVSGIDVQVAQSVDPGDEVAAQRVRER